MGLDVEWVHEDVRTFAPAGPQAQTARHSPPSSVTSASSTASRRSPAFTPA